jgi:iron complex transport system substrate-binding protein
LTRSRIPASTPSAEIDALVVAQGGALYDLDIQRLAELRPDLILTQAQCDVCAVNEVTVRRAAAALPGSPRVESVNPKTLAEVHVMFRRIGDLLEARPAAEALIERFEALAGQIQRRLGPGGERLRVIHLEWLDPPFFSGHWNPELIELGGGQEVLGRAGQPSRRGSWDEVAEADPDVLLVAPCGFGLDRIEVDLAMVEDRPTWRRLRAVRNGRVTVADGSAYFSRPGPRLAESLAIAAAAITQDRCADLAPRAGWRRLVVRE